MKQFNSLGQDEVNKQLLTWMTVADVADNPTTKKVMLDKINAQFSKINAEPAFIDEGLVQIPQPSLMVKYPITTSVTPAELLADAGFK
jgi:hypothetical protein